MARTKELKELGTNGDHGFPEGADALFEALSKPLSSDPLLAALGSAFLAARDRDTIETARKKLREYVSFLDRLLAVVEVAAGLPPGGTLSRHASPTVSASSPVHGDGRVKTGLSAREVEIVKHIASGVSVNTTARELGISPHTVRNHLKACFRKAGVHTQIELVNYAFKQGLVSPP